MCYQKIIMSDGSFQSVIVSGYIGVNRDVARRVYLLCAVHGN
jgi:hypothetical protein